MAYFNYLARVLSDDPKVVAESFVGDLLLLRLAIRYEFYGTKRGREKEYDVFIQKEIGGGDKKEK
jgi:hypothetical protein